METIKWSSRVVPIGAQQIQDGGRPPFWKKTVKSPYLHNRVTDFWWNLAQWHILASYSGSSVKITNFWKSNIAAADILKITKIAISSQWFDRSLRNLLRWCNTGLSTSQTVKNWISKIQDGGQLPFWKPLNHHTSGTFWPILIKFCTVMHVSPWSKVKFLIFDKMKMISP